MFFNWSKVKSSDMWQYQNRVKYLKERLDKLNQEYSDTGKISVSEREYMGISSELYYYQPSLPIFDLMDKSKLTKSVFFKETQSNEKC